MEKLTDEQLIDAYIDGDNEALEFLIRKYLRPVYNFVIKFINNSTDAEDVTQEIFVKLWKNIGKFKADYKFKTWLFTIAKNTALDFIKKKKAIPFSVLENSQEEDFNFADMLISDQESPLEIIEKEEIHDELLKMVDELPAKYKVVLDFHYVEGLKFREIAKITKESIETIKTRNRRAVVLLKKLFYK